MIKRFQMTALAVALAAVSTGSFAADPGAFFINGNVGLTSYNSGTVTSNKTLGVAVRAGYLWYNESWNFGFEGGYVDLGRVSESFNVDGAQYHERSRAQGPLIGMNLKYKFENHWYVDGRVGYLHTSVNTSVSGVGSERLHGGGGYGGLGVGYDLSKNFSLGLSYDNYRIKYRAYENRLYSGNVGTSTVSAEYRF